VNLPPAFLPHVPADADDRGNVFSGVSGGQKEPNLVCGQHCPKRCPFGTDPPADQADCRDHGNQHDAKQNGVFDKRGALFVVRELFYKF
jgi:hypothetical protein